ncbi:substrate-binding periplasmic protein [Chromobacterium sp. CV08]|uniref:substrate-binding periplasmic protein n=1 Tax=Chromobacterium sp. CV08 TaxID=3133274 RepID=UPI003DA9546A
MIRHLLPLWLAAASAAACAAAPPLNILTEDDPPLSFVRDGRPAGLVVEVVREIQRRVGNHDPILVVPWARAYRQAQQEPNTALFNTNRIAERERLFKWVGPVTVTQGSFFVRRDSKLTLDSLDGAKRLGQVLVVRDWYLQLALTAHGFANLKPIATPSQMVSMLMRGRADVIASENTTLPTQLRQLGYRPTDVRPAYTFIHTYGYIAFSPQTSDEVVRAWQRALDGMKRDGGFAAIYRRWLPGEPVPELRAAPPKSG